MVRPLLVRGMLVGLAAGLLAFLVAYVVGEPQVQHAIDFEAQIAQLSNAPAEPELVSRGTQRTVGLLTGTALLGVALGGAFALAFAYAYGRVGALGARATAAMLGLGAFLTITLVPFTKYPANPPTVGSPDTIDRRTVLFVAMISISILTMIAAARIRRQLLPRLGSWNATTIAAATYLAVVLVAQLVLPSVRQTPKGFPADVLWHFRIASLAIGATLWATIGIGFGAAAERILSARGALQRA